MKSLFSSISGRIFAILLFGIIGSTVLTWWLSFGERQKAIAQFRDSHALDRAEQLILALNALPPASREEFLQNAPRIGLRVKTMPSLGTNTLPDSPYVTELKERLGAEFKILSLPQRPEDCPKPAFERRTGHKPCEAIGISLSDGSGLRILAQLPRNPLPPMRPEFLMDLLMFLVSIALLAVIVSRMTIRPLKTLAQAATDLGHDINHPPLAETGATEILQATRAFNAMQSRIRQHIQQRTHMLAAITHDLQTPLTRLRLRLEKVSDGELRDKLIEDLSNMQAMVKEGLELARSMDSNEAFQPLDLASLLDSVCIDANDAGQDVSCEKQTGFTVMARPQSLRRALNNLIDNAVKYGHTARLHMEKSHAGGKRLVKIIVRDTGPGIPEEQQARVLEPFFRIETSRSRDSGGTGLGLTIAQNIAQQHGGNLTMRNLTEGGFEVTLSLPLKTH